MAMPIQRKDLALGSYAQQRDSVAMPIDSSVRKRRRVSDPRSNGTRFGVQSPIDVEGGGTGVEPPVPVTETLRSLLNRKKRPDLGRGK